MAWPFFYFAFNKVALEPNLDKCLIQAPQQIKTCFQNLKDFREASRRIENEEETNKKAKSTLAAHPEMGKMPKIIENTPPQILVKLWESCQTSDSPNCPQMKKWDLIYTRAETFINGDVIRSRILIHIPGENFDQWYSIPLESKKPGEIEMIAAQKKDFSTGEVLREMRPYFFDGRRDRGIKLADFQTCYQCHPNGPRVIHPLPGSVRGDLQKMAHERMNTTLRQYAPTDLSQYVNVAHLWPPLGRAQNCTRCHGDLRDRKLNLPNLMAASFLRLPLNHNAFPQLSAMMVEHIRMPPGLRRITLKPFVKALKRVEKLSIDDQILVASKFEDKVDDASGTVARQGQMFMLELLKARKKIGEFEFHMAKQSLDLAENEARQMFADLKKNAKTDLNFWLRGGNSCVLNQNPVLTLDSVPESLPAEMAHP